MSLLNRQHAFRFSDVRPFFAKPSRVVNKMDTESIGRASVLLGGGRQKGDDVIDFAVGFSEIKRVGEHVDVNEPLLFVHACNEPSLHPFCRCSKTPVR